MKRLTLMRHAKSSWGSEGLADHERPLSGRGQRDAPAMAFRLKVRKARPSLILTSHAARAKATARLVARVLDYPEEFIEVDKALYLASVEAILDVLAAQEARFEDVLLVGHNPGMTELANHLLPGLALDNLPTAGVVAMECVADSWSELGGAQRNLLYYDYPKYRELPEERL